MIELDELFTAVYGVNLEYNKMVELKDGIPFVSRTSRNNGVVGYVTKKGDIPPNPAMTISLSAGGSVMESFLQEEEYYSGRDLYYLKPKVNLSKKELLYYCMVLRANKYRYSFGRQANKTLRKIKIPSLDQIPNYVYEATVDIPSRTPVSQDAFKLTDRKWKSFKYDEIFNVYGGFYNRKPEPSINGTLPFIGATESDNGVSSWHTREQIEKTTKDGKEKNHDIERKIFKGGKYITVSNDGSVGYAFYQKIDFTCSHSVNVLELKGMSFSVFIALFICSLITLEQFRWAYGRKWRPIRMSKSIIKLPVDRTNNPDWQFMEDYIKSLPYSSNL